MTTGIPDSLDRLTQADLIGVVRELIGEVGRLRAENEKLSGALTKLKTEHQAIKDELARLKNLPPRPPQKPSGMDKASDRGGSSFDHRSGGGAKSGGGGKSPRRRGSQLDKLSTGVALRTQSSCVRRADRRSGIDFRVQEARRATALHCCYDAARDRGDARPAYLPGRATIVGS